MDRKTNTTTTTTALLPNSNNDDTQDGTIVDNSEMRLPVTGSVLDDDIISEFNTAQAAIDKFKNGKGDAKTDKGGRRRGSRSAKKRLTKRKRNKKSNRRRKSRRVN